MVIVSFENAEGSKIEINGEKVSVTFDGENVILKGELLELSDPWRYCNCNRRL